MTLAAMSAAATAIGKAPKTPANGNNNDFIIVENSRKEEKEEEYISQFFSFSKSLLDNTMRRMRPISFPRQEIKIWFSTNLL